MRVLITWLSSYFKAGPSTGYLEKPTADRNPASVSRSNLDYLFDRSRLSLRALLVFRSLATVFRGTLQGHSINIQCAEENILTVASNKDAKSVFFSD